MATNSESGGLKILFNDSQQILKNSNDSISPCPSAQSENSIECAQQMLDDETNENHFEQELTNLTWLTQLKSLVAWPDSVKPIFDDDDDGDDKNDNESAINVPKKDSIEERFNNFLEQTKKNRKNYDGLADFFQSNTKEKPPYNYAQIIAMALLENGRMTLQQICSWIEAKFGYYRKRGNWNNSIRHNLSLKYCFRKIERNKFEKRKGGYWELGMDITKSERKRRRNRKTIRDTTEELTSDNINNYELDSKQNKLDDELLNHEVLQEFFNESLKDLSLHNNNDLSSALDETLNILNACEDTGQSIHDGTFDINVIGANGNNFITEDTNINGIQMDSCNYQDQFSTEIQISNGETTAIDNVDTSVISNYNNGPNVIVELLPYSMPNDDTNIKTFFDNIDKEFELLKNSENDDELIDALYEAPAQGF